MKYFHKFIALPLGLLLTILPFTILTGQKKKAEIPLEKKSDVINSALFSALTFRSVGPAVTSGRISDFAVNPKNPSEYYVATASGGVWKTTNKGITYTPIFDGQGSYSIPWILQTQQLFG